MTPDDDDDVDDVDETSDPALYYQSTRILETHDEETAAWAVRQGAVVLAKPESRSSTWILEVPESELSK